MSVGSKFLGMLAGRRSMQRAEVSDPVSSTIQRLNGYSMSGIPVLTKLHGLAQDVVRREVPGDFVECGVCNGGSAGSISLALRGTNKRAWLYDSFQGMPPTTPVDGPDASRYIGECVGAEERVREALAISGFPSSLTVIRKGWFQDTFNEPLPDSVAFLHIDADWYDSVSLCLDTFYDRVTDGGVIVLDDFGCWEGCREAFYDFCTRRGIKPLLERFGFTQAFWIKGRTHNREFKGQWEIP